MKLLIFLPPPVTYGVMNTIKNILIFVIYNHSVEEYYFGLIKTILCFKIEIKPH
jgi:hypothetical protein